MSPVTLQVAALGAVTSVLVGSLLSAYSGTQVNGSFDEGRGLAGSALVVTLALASWS